MKMNDAPDLIELREMVAKLCFSDTRPDVRESAHWEIFAMPRRRTEAPEFDVTLFLRSKTPGAMAPAGLKFQLEGPARPADNVKPNEPKTVSGLPLGEYSITINSESVPPEQVAADRRTVVEPEDASELEIDQPIERETSYARSRLLQREDPLCYPSGRTTGMRTKESLPRAQPEQLSLSAAPPEAGPMIPVKAVSGETNKRIKAKIEKGRDAILWLTVYTSDQGLAEKTVSWKCGPAHGTLKLLPNNRGGWQAACQLGLSVDELSRQPFIVNPVDG